MTLARASFRVLHQDKLEMSLLRCCTKSLTENGEWRIENIERNRQFDMLNLMVSIMLLLKSRADQHDMTGDHLR